MTLDIRRRAGRNTGSKERLLFAPEQGVQYPRIALVQIGVRESVRQSRAKDLPLPFAVSREKKVKKQIFVHNQAKIQPSPYCSSNSF